MIFFKPIASFSFAYVISKNVILSDGFFQGGKLIDVDFHKHPNIKRDSSGNLEDTSSASVCYDKFHSFWHKTTTKVIQLETQKSYFP